MNYQNINATERWLIIIAVMSATIMQVLDTTIVNVALPYMQGSLNATSDQISWTLTSYLVSSAIFMPLTGYLTDRLGRKNYLLGCIVGFTAASILCGAAQSLSQMVIFRLLQGAFGAGLVPLSQAIMADIYPPHERGKAMAIWGAGVMLGPILGPSLGGYLTDIANWRWTFYVNVPIGVLTALLAWQVTPDTPKKRRGMDWVGLIYISTAIAATQYVLDRGNQENWFAGTSIQLASMVGGLSLIAFLLNNLQKHPYEVFDLSIFKDRNFTVASIVLAIFGLGLYGTMVIQPLMLENLLNYPVLTSGLSMVPRGLSSMLSMIIVGKIIHKVDPKKLIIIGILLAAIGTGVGTYYSLNVNLWWIVWPLLFQGFGLGMIFVPLAAVAFSTLPAKARAEAAGLYSLLRTMGSSIGIAVTITLWTRHSQVAWNEIGAHIQAINPAVSQYLAPLHLQANSPQGAAVLGQMLSQQAGMVSFVSVFSFITWSFLAMIPLVFLLKSQKGTSASAAAISD
jgi:DHA2 family multidrug resistance protein